MKHFATFSSLLVTCGLFAGCDQQQDLPHNNTVPEANPTTVAGKPRDGADAGAARDAIGHNERGAHGADSGRNYREAEADIEPAKGMELEGEVDLKETADGVEIVAEIEDASPGKHGFHIHEKGDCGDLPGKSMGDHFNPDSKAHMLPHEGDARHLGDLGNIEVGKDGNGKVKFTLKGANLKPGDSHSLLGRSFVIHEREDSGQGKQPAGDSGEPIACGVINAEKS